MLEFTDIREWLTLLFSLVIVPVVYILRQARGRIEEKVEATTEEVKENGRKMDVLDERARVSNGRLTKLEAWSTYHQQQDTSWCHDIRAELAALRKLMEGK